MPAFDQFTLNAIKAKMTQATDNKSIAKVTQFVQLVLPAQKYSQEQLKTVYVGLKDARTLINSIYDDLNAALEPTNTDEKQIASSKTAANQTFAKNYAATFSAQMASQNQASLSTLTAAQIKVRNELLKNLDTIKGLAEENWGAKFDARCPSVRSKLSANAPTTAGPKLVSVKS